MEQRSQGPAAMDGGAEAATGMPRTDLARLEVSFELNGESVRTDVQPHEVLVETLRERFGKTGTKLGCGVGACGICSVLIDGEVLSACLVPTVAADGGSVVTIEGLHDHEPELTAALEQHFEVAGGYQCGICTPGQLIACVALLRANPRPSDRQIRTALAGNLCRCTGYSGIVAAVIGAAEQTHGRPG